MRNGIIIAFYRSLTLADCPGPAAVTRRPTVQYENIGEARLKGLTLEKLTVQTLEAFTNNNACPA